MKDLFIKAGVGVLVYKEDMVLMIKRANSHGRGTWAPPGGHIGHQTTNKEGAWQGAEKKISNLESRILNIG